MGIRTKYKMYGVRHIRVFGSVACCEETSDSDVDFPRGYDLLTQRRPLAKKLSQLVCRKVNLVPEHELNRHICDQVLEEAVDL